MSPASCLVHGGAFRGHDVGLKQGFPKVDTGFGIKTLLKQRTLSSHSLAKPGMSAWCIDAFTGFMRHCTRSLFVHRFYQTPAGRFRLDRCARAASLQMEASQFGGRSRFFSDRAQAPGAANSQLSPGYRCGKVAPARQRLNATGASPSLWRCSRQGAVWSRWRRTGIDAWPPPPGVSGTSDLVGTCARGRTESAALAA